MNLPAFVSERLVNAGEPPLDEDQIELLKFAVMELYAYGYCIKKAGSSPADAA